ncbi:PD40 domain-containing protein [bacterium AH-315-P13]|nr:PD40 domain-containing protein [bacterium AH-315-P13]MBN4085314.1 PD40 domain-containing protein [Flavobacteriaceae bacterium AH-315-B10]
MNKGYYILSILGLAFVLHSCKTVNSHNLYLGQKAPSGKPELFAPWIINTEDIEINSVFNSSFTELFFTRIVDGSFVIHHSRLIDGNWTSPEPIQMFSDSKANSVAIDPSITQDGNVMYFLGISPKDYINNAPPDIYLSQKINGKWQIASKVESPISTKYADSYPVVVADGSIYFESDRPGGLGKRDIYRAQYLGDGKFDTPVNIGTIVNSEKNAGSTYVSPDESYLITTDFSHEGKGFYVSFKENNEWQKPIFLDLVEPLEKGWIYFAPYVSPDGKYFFFSRRYSNPPESGWNGITKGEVYWVNANGVLDLKRK